MVQTAALPGNVNQNTGLTSVEEALLSNEEKAMRFPCRTNKDFKTKHAKLVGSEPLGISWDALGNPKKRCAEGSCRKNAYLQTEMQICWK